MDADTLESTQLERRQRMAIDRRRRESDRLSLLAKLVDGKHRADELRNWIDAFVPVAAEGSHPELQRMLSWAQTRLAELEAFLEAHQVTALIHERDLFPEIDQLNDPLGETPASSDLEWLLIMRSSVTALQSQRSVTSLPAGVEDE